MEYVVVQITKNDTEKEVQILGQENSKKRNIEINVVACDQQNNELLHFLLYFHIAAGGNIP